MYWTWKVCAWIISSLSSVNSIINKSLPVGFTKHFQIVIIYISKVNAVGCLMQCLDHRELQKIIMVRVCTGLSRWQCHIHSQSRGTTNGPSTTAALVCLSRRGSQHALYLAHSNKTKQKKVNGYYKSGHESDHIFSVLIRRIGDYPSTRRKNNHETINNSNMTVTCYVTCRSFSGKYLLVRPKKQSKPIYSWSQLSAEFCPQSWSSGTCHPAGLTIQN